MPTILRWRTIAATDAFHVARSWKTPATPTPLHSHDFAEVFWIDTGTGTQTSPTGTETLRAGDIRFIRPTDVHALESLTTMQLTNIAFPRDTFDWLTNRYSSPWKKPKPRQLDAAELQWLARSADELASAPRTRLVIERFLLNLLYRLTPAPAALPAELPEWLRHACVEITKPQLLRAGTPAFAKLAGRSPEHVARVTRDLLRETPSNYINRLRMHHAARQLAMTDAKIMDIALNCGLTNLSHFYRLFRRQFGLTPQAYRQQQRGLA